MCIRDRDTVTEIRESDEDIEVLKNHPLVPSHIDIFGFIFDINSGELKLID